MNKAILGGVILMFASAIFGQPVIGTGGVVNASSYTPAGLPNSGIAQGSLFLIYGSGLGPATPASANSFPLPKQLGGTSVKMTVGGTTVDVIVAYSSPSQLVALLPSATPVGDGTITVTYNGQTSATQPIKVVRNAFGIGAISGGGSGPGVFTDPNFTPITLINSAKPGDLVFIWGTGLGAVQEDESLKAPTAGNLPYDVKVYVGGKEATVTYKGRSGCCAGLDQILFTVPQGVEGCYVPVAVSVAGVVSNFTSISISSQTNRLCSDPLGLTAAQLGQLASGRTLKVGQVNLQRIASDVSAFGITISVKEDRGTALFYDFDPRSLLVSRGLTDISNFGSCKVQQCNSDVCIPDRNPLVLAALDAGTAITVAGPKGSKDLAKTDNGSYVATLFDRLDSLSNSEGYLTAGNYTITGKGGKDVGAFTASVTIPTSPVSWTNKTATTSVDRANPLTVTWSGGTSSDWVSVFGSSTGSAGTTSTFICTERASAGQLTVPTWVLSALPSSGTLSVSGISVPAGFLLIGVNAASTNFTAPGIDAGFLSRQIVEGKNLVFR